MVIESERNDSKRNDSERNDSKVDIRKGIYL